MGFQLPDLSNAQFQISRALGEIHSSYNDGWTASHCKKNLYMLKCWLEDEYNQLPKFTNELEWEKDRLIQKLQQK